eukprot:TRINITY_DN22132_c0_g1_i1.p2 TRINITY_DN22132_c0_g1~~TRINITY_DN22132_c0_g1_i1.p2  ORF type:complete len:201 (+),score=91.09 TRINITY_DN22132_c0_g1_i1:90-692(+)
MTTAHRPTWNSAIASGATHGGNRQVVQQGFVSARDLPQQLSLKRRADLQKDRRPEPPRDAPAAEAGAARAKEEERRRLAAPKPLDADADLASSELSSEEEDDEAELMAELAKIKRERAEEAERKRQEEARRQAQENESAVLQGNPLLNPEEPAVGAKRRWDDDVIFRNQARKDEEGAKRRFVNDTVRSDFHRRFLDRYLR